MKPKLYIFFFITLLYSSCITKNIFNSQDNSIITVKEKEDKSINDIINPYKIQIDSAMNQVLCTSLVNMEKGKPESLLGNFVTDLCLEICNQDLYDSRTTKLIDSVLCSADICIMNNGGLRSSLDSGIVTRGMIYELMPFDNELVIINLSTLELFDLIDHMMISGEPFSGMHISSPDSIILYYNHDDYINYVLIRNVDSVIIGHPVWDWRGNYLYEKYHLQSCPYNWNIITSDYLANGGDNMSFFIGKDQIKTGLKVRDAIINYCISERKIISNLDRRFNSDERIYEWNWETPPEDHPLDDIE